MHLAWRPSWLRHMTCVTPPKFRFHPPVTFARAKRSTSVMDHRVSSNSAHADQHIGEDQADDHPENHFVGGTAIAERHFVQRLTNALCSALGNVQPGLRALQRGVGFGLINQANPT